MRLLKVLPFLLTAVLFYQCQKEIKNTGDDNPPVIVGPEPVSARLQGNIIDENNQPAQGVTVKVGSQATVTDSRGYFSFNNASLDKKSALVTAEKAGYFKAYRTFAATSATNQVVIKLLKRTLAGTIDAASGGSVTLSNGAKITIPANAVVRASNNSAYPGTVNVYATYIDPTATDIMQTVPGSFMANDKDGSRVTLASYGMLAVELESAGNEKLQIKTGETAHLATPIPASRLSSAPALIPLWYVDEQTGIWKEEGSAMKQGNEYVGDVRHFTYWNCDVPLPTIQMTLTLLTAGGQPLSYVMVSIRVQNGNYYGSAHGYTDSLGTVNGPVPANVPLALDVFSWCGGVQTLIYTQPIGSFSQNTNLGTITITNPLIQPVTITGQLNNCSGNPVANGSAWIFLNNILRVATTNSNGIFSLTLPPCSSAQTAQIIGVDHSAQQQSTLSTFTLTVPTTNVGVINACGTSTSQFFNYTMDGTSFSFVPNPADSLYLMWTSPNQGGGYTTGFHFNQQVAPIFVYMSFTHPALTTGTYPITQFMADPFGSSTVILPSFNTVVTNFPQAIGQYCEGTFSGQFKDSVNVTHTISNGSFRVRKSY